MEPPTLVEALDSYKLKLPMYLSLRNVHTLYLHNTNIADVTYLGNVHILDMSCIKVKDIRY